MSDPGDIAAMGRELARQLAVLRRRAGLTQHGLAAMAGFSRTTVSMAELGRGYQARQFWEGCDKALDTGGTLTAAADQLDAARDAQRRAAARAAQQGRQARMAAALAAPSGHSSAQATITAVQECPHCGGPVTVLAILNGEITPAQEASRQQG